ncbi:TPA: hypothetical protein DIV48_02950 [Candidatus Kaiserbacteria bacterium]|nr:hypothetical protein [Candidatus Kaiserbacteria bacterium]
MNTNAWAVLTVLIILVGLGIWIIAPQIAGQPGGPSATTTATGTSTSPTSADNAPPGSIHNLPVPQAVSAARAYAARALGVSEGLVIVMTAYEKEWTDSCLGLGGPAESCAQVITPGYEVTVQANGKQYMYRTNATGEVIRQAK